MPPRILESTDANLEAESEIDALTDSDSTPANADALAQLRVLRANQQWDDSWIAQRAASTLHQLQSNSPIRWGESG